MDTGLEEKATLKSELEEVREALGRRDTEVCKFSFSQSQSRKRSPKNIVTGEGASSSTRHPGEKPQAAVDCWDEEEEGGEEAVGGGRGAHQDPGGAGGREGQTDQQAEHLKYTIISTIPT